MKTPNERLRELRKDILKTSCQKMSEQLSVGHSVLSKIELGKSKLTERLANEICDVYHVNYQWLMDGEDVPVFIDEPSYLDFLVDEYDLTEGDKILVQFYLENPDMRETLKKVCLKYAEAMKKDD